MSTVQGESTKSVPSKSKSNSSTASSSTATNSTTSSKQSTPGPTKIYDYDYNDLHNDLESNNYGGAYGANNGCYLGIAEKKANVDLNKFHSKRTKDEYYIPELKELLDNKKTKHYWKRIVTFDPYGMIATNPTIAATNATLYIPEFIQNKIQIKSDKDNNSNQNNTDNNNTTNTSNDNTTTNDNDVLTHGHTNCSSHEHHHEEKKTIEDTNPIKLARAKSLPPKMLLKSDKIIVTEDFGINCIKAGIHYAWNIPSLSERLEISEQQFRNALFKYTGNPSCLLPNIRCYLPPVGGLTLYIFGDPRKIRNRLCEIAVRVHDECNGSDVFSTDICTCRPYLIFSIKLCIEVAQRGGVGIIAYFRKEGRSLGEVTKYRVYNARRNQKGGDRPEKYFYQTESIAGIQDARFQTMMPDVLHWLGVDHIDWLISMSSEKYDAITRVGKIRVNQRVSLPDSYVPKHADIELTAKIMSGYHMDKLNLLSTFNMEENNELLIDDLRNLKSIRRQCKRIYNLALENKLSYFELHLENLSIATDTVIKTIEKYYPDPNTIPLHSRLRHFDKNRIENLINKWDNMYVDKIEQCRRIIDLLTISVLLDAGAGPNWSYLDSEGTKYTRSEGLAIASFDMFMDGIFSTDIAIKCRVNSLALKNIDINKLKLGFQVSKNNLMIGLEGRCKVIKKLGIAMEKYPQYFGYEIQRPGHLLDYCLNEIKKNKQNNKDNNNNNTNEKDHISVHTLWKGIIYGMQSIWPGKLQGVARGDVWRYMPLNIAGEPGSDLVPFHKLQQWLCYSLIEAMTVYYNKFEFDDLHDMTCLAEYRNGGLFIDTNVLILKNLNKSDNDNSDNSDTSDNDSVNSGGNLSPSSNKSGNDDDEDSKKDDDVQYDAGSELCVEWRAMTIMLADMVANDIRKRLGKTEDELSLPKVLEGGIWRAGRELAFKLRPNGTPPINIRRDGTVF